jgi:hypothetical protein
VRNRCGTVCRKVKHPTNLESHRSRMTSDTRHLRLLLWNSKPRNNFCWTQLVSALGSSLGIWHNLNKVMQIKRHTVVASVYRTALGAPVAINGGRMVRLLIIQQRNGSRAWYGKSDEVGGTEGCVRLAQNRKNRRKASIARLHSSKRGAQTLRGPRS